MAMNDGNRSWILYPCIYNRRLLKDQVCEATNKGHNFKIMPLLPILLKP